MAEAQVSKLANGDASGKSTVVSVKSSVAVGQKRKAEDDGKGKDKKSTSRRSMKKTKR